MSLTAWSVLYLVEICCWYCLCGPFRKEDRDGRAAAIMVWLVLVAFSTVTFFVGLKHPDLRNFLVRLQ